MWADRFSWNNNGNNEQQNKKKKKYDVYKGTYYVMQMIRKSDFWVEMKKENDFPFSSTLTPSS